MSLVYDILYTIFDFLRITPDYEIDRAELCKLCFVCRSWTIPAQQLLYHHISLRYRDTFESFLTSVNGPLKNRSKSESLRNAIYVLDIWIYHGSLNINPADLPRLLHLLPRLSDLRLRLGPEVISLASKPRAFEKLRHSFPISTLRAIQVHLGVCSSQTTTIAQLFQIIDPSTLNFIGIFSEVLTVPSLPFSKLDGSKWRIFNEHYATPLAVEFPLQLSTAPGFKPISLAFATHQIQEQAGTCTLLSFVGPTLRSLTTAGPLWTQRISICVEYTPNLQHLCTLEALWAGPYDTEPWVEFDMHLDREPWASGFLDWKTENYYPPANRHNMWWAASTRLRAPHYRPKEAWLVVRKVVAYGKWGAWYSSWSDGDEFKEVVKEPRERADARPKCPEMRRIFIAVKQ